jgi:hypothetical protein
MVYFDCLYAGVLMQEVAQGTFTYEHFPEVMTMLWKRMLQDNKKNWRRTYKVVIIVVNTYAFPYVTQYHTLGNRFLF